MFLSLLIILLHDCKYFYIASILKGGFNWNQCNPSKSATACFGLASGLGMGFRVSVRVRNRV